MGGNQARPRSTVAGLVAGALSMAAGEYVSVSSQTDTEKADIEREIIESIENSKPTMCAFHEVEMMDITPKIIKEISKMKDLGYYSLNTQKMIDMNPRAVDPNRSEIRAYGAPEKSGVVKRFDNTTNNILE